MNLKSLNTPPPTHIIRSIIFKKYNFEDIMNLPRTFFETYTLNYLTIIFENNI